MKTIPGDNAANTSRPVLTDSDAEWVAFDRLPFAVKEALREAPFDYSAREVSEFFEQAAINSRSYASFFDRVKKDDHAATQETLEAIQRITNDDLKPYWQRLGQVFPWSNAKFDKTRQAFRRPLTSR